MQMGTFNKQRGDYREMCELVAVYLGGSVLRRRIDGTLTEIEFKMRHPGTFQQRTILSKSPVSDKNVNDGRCFA